jgi:toxin ParE1/3/4
MMEPEGGYRVCLTPESKADLEVIWVYSARVWSVEQANDYIDGLVGKFDLLAKAPFMARERTEFVPPVRVHRHQSHVIIYRLLGTDLQVIRIAHLRQNWASLLGE